jgi:hypothetical protein
MRFMAFIIPSTIYPNQFAQALFAIRVGNLRTVDNVEPQPFRDIAFLEDDGAWPWRTPAAPHDAARLVYQSLPPSVPQELFKSTTGPGIRRFVPEFLSVSYLVPGM